MLDETAFADELLLLLTDVPEGEYLVEHREGVRLLWRLTGGSPQDEALEAAPVRTA